MRISSQLSDTPIMTLAIAGGILVALLTLFVVETPERMVDTAIHFDMSVTAFFGRFARRSPVVNTLLWWVWTQPATQAGIVMALLWGAWFGNRETPEGRPKRVAMLSALVGTYASILVTLVFRLHPGRQVSARILAAAVTIYLMFGLLFAEVYILIGLTRASGFFAQPGPQDAVAYLYFSFITLTTVGFGDLTPAGDTSRILTTLEALSGQLYLVTVLAVVVSSRPRRQDH